MEPNRLEQEIKEKLDNRIIQPSVQAWDRLDSMLGAVEKPKAKFPWMYVAAGFVGLSLMCTTVLFNVETENVNKEVPIVVKPKIEVDNQKEQKTINETVLPIKVHKAVVQSYLIKQSRKTMNSDTKVVIKEQLENDAIVISSENKNYQSTVKNRYISAEKLLAEVSNAQFESTTTDETMRNTTKTISVNPTILLSNAETELNQSFKESALDRLNKNFKTIRTVLVNRNYED